MQPVLQRDFPPEVLLLPLPAYRLLSRLLGAPALLPLLLLLRKQGLCHALPVSDGPVPALGEILQALLVPVRRLLEVDLDLLPDLRDRSLSSGIGA